MPAYYDEQTKSWYCKFYYTDYTGAKKQKKKRGFKLPREAKELYVNNLNHLLVFFSDSKLLKQLNKN